MEKYAPTIKDLAPRDLISRAIVTEIREGRGIDYRDFVHLDLTGIGKGRLSEKLSDIWDFATMQLVCMARHDAAHMNYVCEAGMIFIPCVDGTSHAPGEMINWGDLEKGANLLLNALIRLAG